MPTSKRSESLMAILEIIVTALLVAAVLVLLFGLRDKD